MRYAVFSDIHGNLPAWENVLADIREAQVDTLICLGDVVGYGPKPQEVLDSIRSETSNFVLGNHDAAAAGLIDPSIFNDHAQSVVYWTRENMSQSSIDFFKQVPLELETPEILFVHAEVPEPGRFGYIEDENHAAESFAARDHFITFVGHTHHPECFESIPDKGIVRKLGDHTRRLNPDHRYIINVGSVGEPRNPEDIRARYVIYDDDTKEVDFRSVRFDCLLYRDQLRATDMTHTPYFLQIFEKRAGAIAHVQDMQVPAHVTSTFSTQRKTLNIPPPRRPAVNPYHLASTPKKSKAGLVWVFITMLTLLAGGIGWYLYGQQNRQEPASVLADESETINARSTLNLDARPEPQVDDLKTAQSSKPQEKKSALRFTPNFVVDATKPNGYRKYFTKHVKHRPKQKKVGGRPIVLDFSNAHKVLHSSGLINPNEPTYTIVTAFKLNSDQRQIIFKQQSKPVASQLPLVKAQLELINGDHFLYYSNENNKLEIPNTHKQSWQIFVIIVNRHETDNVIVIHNESPPKSMSVPFKSPDMKLAMKPFEIGGIPTATFSGFLCEFRYYNAVLSTEQLRADLTALQRKWNIKYAIQLPEIEARR